MKSTNFLEILVYFLFIGLSSCEGDDFLNANLSNVGAINPDEMSRLHEISDDLLMAPANETDPIMNPTVTEKDIVGGMIIQGDIIIPKGTQNDPTVLNNAAANTNLKWTKGVIPYVIDPTFNSNERLVIGKAIDTYHSKTCIKFVPRVSQTDYIHIMKGSGCYSNIGKTGGRQYVSLGNGCVYVGIVIHELMHAVGFWHEQSRSDRDNYIKIMWANVQSSMVLNFQKMPETTINHLGQPYDTCSVMHYNAYAFSINLQPTIVLKEKNPKCTLGQRIGFSEIDVKKINQFYNCKKFIEKENGVDTGDNEDDDDDDDENIIEDNEEECSDNVDYKEDCKYWAKKEECKKNPSWMLPNCAKSCNQCNTKCLDFHIHCLGWMKLGYCKKYSAYMKSLCKNACICKKCKDDEKKCKKWATKGYCKHRIYKYFMKLRCQKSCGLCP